MSDMQPHLVDTSGDYDPKEYWNRKARESGGNPSVAVCHPWPEANRSIDRIQERLVARALAEARPKGDLVGWTVLDYGCGSGRWAAFFRWRGADFKGVEIAERMLALAASQDPEGEYALVEGGIVPYADASIDLVTSIGVLHHNPFTDQEEILDEVARVLKPGGYLLLFEAIGPPDPLNPIEFARAPQGWHDLMVARGFERHYFEGARYFAFRSVVECCLRRISPGSPQQGRPWWYRPLEWVGVYVDPYLGRLLPTECHDRAVMLFRKSE